MCRDGVSGEEGAGVGKEAPPDEKFEACYCPTIHKHCEVVVGRFK